MIACTWTFASVDGKVGERVGRGSTPSIYLTSSSHYEAGTAHCRHVLTVQHQACSWAASRDCVCTVEAWRWIERAKNTGHATMTATPAMRMKCWCGAAWHSCCGAGNYLAEDPLRAGGAVEIRGGTEPRRALLKASLSSRAGAVKGRLASLAMLAPEM